MTDTNSAKVAQDYAVRLWLYHIVIFMLLLFSLKHLPNTTILLGVNCLISVYR